MSIIRNLFSTLLGIQNDPHLGPPAARIAHLERYRGQGEDDAIDTMQRVLRDEPEGGYTDDDLLAAARQAGMR
jgi:hypothetical protein